MNLRFSELKCREVININDGKRIGFVCDLEIDCTCGEVVCLIVPGKAKFFGLFGKEHDFHLPWKCIRRIGDDIILVEVDLDKHKKPCDKRKFFKF